MKFVLPKQSQPHAHSQNLNSISTGPLIHTKTGIGSGKCAYGGEGKKSSIFFFIFIQFIITKRHILYSHVVLESVTWHPLITSSVPLWFYEFLKRPPPHPHPSSLRGMPCKSQHFETSLKLHCTPNENATTDSMFSALNCRLVANEFPFFWGLFFCFADLCSHFC